MKLKKLYNKPLKAAAVLLNLLCVAGMILSIFMYSENRNIRFSEYGYNEYGFADGTFEDSWLFTSLLYEDMQQAVRYSWMRDIFETDGKLDMSKKILRIKNGEGKEESFTLKDMVTMEIGGSYRPAELFYGYEGWGDYSVDYRDTSYVLSEGGIEDYNDEIQNLVREYENALLVNDTQLADEIQINLGERGYDILQQGNEFGGISDTGGVDSEFTGTDMIYEVLWFACDKRFPTVDAGENAMKDLKVKKRDLGWSAADLLNNYVHMQKEYSGGHNFNFKLTGSKSASNTDKTDEELMKLGKYFIVESNGNGYQIKSNIPEAMYQNFSLQGSRYGVLVNEGDRLIAGIDTEFTAQDYYYHTNEAWSSMSAVKMVFPLLLAFALLTIIYLCMAAGKSSGGVGTKLNFIDRIPLELMGAVFAAGCAAWVYIVWRQGWLWTGYLDEWYFEENGIFISPNIIMNTVFAAYALGIILLLSTLRRIRSKQYHSVMLSAFGTLRRAAKEHLSLAAKTGLACIVSVGIISICSLIIGSASGGNWYWGGGKQKLLLLAVVLILPVFSFALLVFLVKMALQKEHLKNGASRIAAGELEYRIPLDKVNPSDRKLADDINHIRDGLSAAVENAMKNERTKTELITNVSHDIKTPLTSIINYVDLLKREPGEAEKTKQYLDILEQKANRLKVLTEDLVEASKASSGTLKLDTEQINFVELVSQVNGEFTEKFHAKNLSMIASLPEEPLYILADGRRVWRILENLYNNVVKYAMENTRVYVNVGVAQESAAVSFTIRNVSMEPLNISAEELTERFVRGDVSRTTEGSGLGLSIAKSLTELQGGTLEIFMDGDLFRVTVQFARV